MIALSTVNADSPLAEGVRMTLNIDNLPWARITACPLCDAAGHLPRGWSRDHPILKEA